MLDAATHPGVATPATASFQARSELPCGRMPPAPHWAVCYTHPQAERWAAQQLQRSGYRVLLPLLAVRRRDPVIRSLWHVAEVPLFPRYLFVHLDGPWTPIRYSPGVRSLLMDGTKPGIVPDAAVRAVQAGEALRRIPPTQHELERPGTPLQASLGGGQKVNGVMISVRGRKATILAIMFGALREITVATSRLQPRSDAD